MPIGRVHAASRRNSAACSRNRATTPERTNQNPIMNIGSAMKLSPAACGMSSANLSAR